MVGTSFTCAGRITNSLGFFISGSAVCHCLTDAIQALCKHFSVHAHANTEVIGDFEEATRNCGCVEFRSQALKKNIRVFIKRSQE